MGHYTGLQVRAKLKPEFVAPIKRLYELNHHRSENPFQPESRWLCLASEYPDFPGIQVWGAMWRSDFIPFGYVASSPLEDKDPEWQQNISDEGVWQFQCGIKNYEDEIDVFAREVLRHIVEGEPLVCRAISEDGWEWNPLKETSRQAHKTELYRNYYGED